ncbi:putative dehydrogenase [Escherichia coli]|uniref:Putative dehydrogenase n=1 Tax=Escherichia coli TaxID=562 RepID=A0A376RET1_ECOLX|nr:putative dehydrogenase [Escherichia coli]
MQLRKLLLPGRFRYLLAAVRCLTAKKDVVRCPHCQPLKTSLRRPRRGVLPLVAALATSIPIFIRHWRTTLSMQRDRAGLVKALNADDGKEIWSVSLAEKDGWFSKSLHYFLAV